jgi:hypothetical protein
VEALSNETQSTVTSETLGQEIDALRLTASALLRRISGMTPLVHSAEILTDLDSLELEIINIIDNKKSLRAFAPRLLLRRWAVASFWKARQKARLARKHFDEDDERFIQEVRFAALWAYQGCDMAQSTDFVKKVLENLETFTLYSSHVEKGDVVLSYKTNAYLQHDFLARIISIATNSHITHALMVSGDTKPHQLLSANPRSAGIGFNSMTPKKGEMFIVMRYRSSIDGVSKEKILESLDTVYNPFARHEKPVSFAELKSWMACFVGLVYYASILLSGRPVCLPNPVKKNSTLFCSEFIDEVFRRADAYLSPRSEHHSVVGPSEFFFSPFLELKGVIFHPEERTELIRQISRTFMLLIEVPLAAPTRDSIE